MATFVNDLRLTELATGEGSGTWGTTTNQSLELIGESLGYATQQAFSSDADATTTVADGVSDPARAMYFKVTSAGSLSATRTLTIAPNTISRVMFIENATSGSQSIAISQGSGANVTILTGKTAVVYLDGAGSGAAVVDAMAGVDPGVTDTLAEVLTAGNTTTTDQKIQFRDAAIYINSSADGQLDIVADTEIQIAATTVDLNGNLDVSGTALVTGVLTTTAATVHTNGITMPDDAKAIFGAGSDLQIFSNGTSSYIIEGGSGNLEIRATDIFLKSADNTKALATFDADGAASISHNGSTKLATSASGISVTGSITADGANIDGAVTTGDITIDNDDTPTLNFKKAASDDVLGTINVSTDAGSGGKMVFQTKRNGNTAADRLTIDDDGAATFSGDIITSTAGTSNLRLGVNAGNSIASGGNYNVVVGDEAGTAITTGDLNTALGYIALAAEDTGGRSTAIGAYALSVQNVDGIVYNTAVGYNAGGAITTGLLNTFVGANSGDATTTANNNAAFGYSSLSTNTTGASNTAIGDNALAANTTASNNTAVGYVSLAANTTGTRNVALGAFALDSNTTASDNTALGYATLTDNITGIQNVAVGAEALLLNTASNNTAVGNDAMRANTTGAGNTAIGSFALDSNTTGTQNVAVGGAALDANTTASNNTAVGYYALLANTTGTQNVAVGATALDANTTATNNTAVGYLALSANTTGPSNTAVGSASLDANTTGSSNVALGYGTLSENTTASNNTAVGYVALLANTTGDRNVAVGTEALDANTTADGNTAVGYQSLSANTTAEVNTAIGFSTLRINTTGGANTAVGAGALDANTTASYNVAVGYYALKANTTGADNVATGSQALQINTTGGSNSAFGRYALLNNTTASFNTAVGRSALQENTTGANNVGVGYRALYVNTTGERNTAIGTQSGRAITTSIQNNLFGYESGYNLTTGSRNTFIGSYVGYGVTSGAGNTFIGNSGSNDQAGAGYYMTTGSDNTIVGGFTGNQNGLDIRTSSNNIVLSDGVGNPRGIFDSSGNFSVGTTSFDAKLHVGSDLTSLQAFRAFGTTTGDTANVCGQFAKYDNNTTTSQIFVNFTVNNGGTAQGQINANGASQAAFGAWSDRRLKLNIENLPSQLANITALRPVEFDYIESEGGGHQLGFIAQEVEEIYPDLVGERPDGMKTLSSLGKWEARLVKAIQEQQATIEALTARIAALEE